MRGALFITFITPSVNLCLIENTGCFFFFKKKYVLKIALGSK